MISLFGKLKGNGSKTLDSKASREVHAIKRALTSNGRKPEVKLSENIGIPIDSYTPRCNMNAFLFGGSDEEKRNKHIEPNIAAFNRNLLIIDTDDSMYSKYCEQLENRGFSVSLIDLNKVDELNYNPLGFVFSEHSALQLAQGIMDGLEDDISKEVKGAWEAAEQSLLFAVIWALSKTKESAILADVAEIFSGGTSELDKLFSAENADAANEYKKFQQDVSPETQKGIILSLAEKLAPLKAWNKTISSADCMSEAREFVFGKKAVFIVIPSDKKRIMTPGLIVRQTITAIIGEMEVKGIFRTQYPLHFIINSIDKAGRIHDFEKVLADAVSHTFAFSLFAPSIASVGNVFGDEKDSILGQCDTFIYFGNADFGTLDWLSREVLEGADGSKVEVPNEEIKNAAKNLEDNKIFIKIQGFTPVTDEAAHV